MPASSPIEPGVLPRRAWLRRAAAWAGAASLSAALLGCASGPATTGAPDEVRRALAPTGTLRIAVYPGSPTSLVREAPPEQRRGVTLELGQEMARRLGVPHEVRVYARVAEVVDAVQRGDADMTITNATAERQARLDFAPPMIGLELGLLVRSGAPLTTVDAMDSAGARIGVSLGSSSQGVLGARLKQATLVPMPSLAAAREALVAGRLDGFATNKAILFELADGVPGARVLDGRWGLEHLALGVPKGRPAGQAWLRRFVADVQADGSAQRAAERAGLRGTVPAAP